MTSLVLVGLSAAVAGALLTPWMQALSFRFGILDVPAGRSSHTVPMPRLGGVALAVAALGAWTVATLARDGDRAIVTLSVGALVAAATGIYDDVRTLRPGLKLLGEVVAVAPLLLAIGMPPIAAPAAWMVIAGTALWVVWYMNAFNFMDGSDGLAATFAAISLFALGLAALRAGLGGAASVAFSTAGASLGFLPSNWPPARIFMGDGGSLFIGYVCGALVVVLIDAGVDPIAVMLPLTPFLFDSGFTLLRRLTRLERVWQAHRTHLYQRLLVVGWNHSAVARLYAAGALVCGGAGIAYFSVGAAMRVVLVAVALLWGAIVLAVVARAEAAVAARCEPDVA